MITIVQIAGLVLIAAAIGLIEPRVGWAFVGVVCMIALYQGWPP